MKTAELRHKKEDPHRARQPHYPGLGKRHTPQAVTGWQCQGRHAGKCIDLFDEVLALGAEQEFDLGMGRKHGVVVFLHRHFNAHDAGQRLGDRLWPPA